MAKGTPNIRFEDLDGEDEMVDPLERDDGSFADGEDPRADDPFREQQDDDDSEDDLDVSVEPDDDPDAGGGGAAAAAPEAPADELTLLRARLAELENERELSRKERDEAQKSLLEARTKKVDEDLAATKAALKAAIEEGDTDKQVDLQDKLAQLHVDKRELAAAPKKQSEPDPDMPRVEARNPQAAKWIQGKAWINNPAHREQNQDLIRMAGVLVQDGYDPSAAEYYEELERRMKRRHPSLFPAPPAKPQVQRKPANQHVGRVSRDDPPRTNVPSKRRVVLTAEDKRNMLRFNLDPSNPAHLREYARNKEVDRVVA